MQREPDPRGQSLSSSGLSLCSASASRTVDNIFDIDNLRSLMPPHVGNDSVGEGRAAQCLAGLRLVHVRCSVSIVFADADACGSTEHRRMIISLAGPGCFIATVSRSARAWEAIPRACAAAA